MSALRDAAEDYLAIRRSLGFRLDDHGWLLASLTRHLEQAGAASITTELALAWATSSPGTQTWHAARLSVARGFARYLATLDPATQVPPEGLLTYRRRRARPHLYSEEEISLLLDAAQKLTPAIRAATYPALIGLLAASGLRVGEALRLDHDDADLGRGLLTVRMTKFGKSRQVPLHPTTVAALDGYARRRDQLCPRPKAPSFFLSSWATRPHVTVVHKTFRELCRRAGVQDPRHPGRPRLHDFRHTFAVRALLGWHTAGADVQARLPWLSTYMGHVDPSSTYWYYSDSRVIPIPAPLPAWRACDLG
jgi:integrase